MTLLEIAIMVFLGCVAIFCLYVVIFDKSKQPMPQQIRNIKKQEELCKNSHSK